MLIRAKQTGRNVIQKIADRIFQQTAENMERTLNKSQTTKVLREAIS